jgi:hypothetical protein
LQRLVEPISTTAGQLFLSTWSPWTHSSLSFEHLPKQIYFNSGAPWWLNRDPIGESGGVNLYAYVDDNPLSMVDLLNAQRLKRLSRAMKLSEVFGGWLRRADGTNILQRIGRSTT